MAIYNALLSTARTAASSAKAGFTNLKATAGSIREMAIAAKESETVRSASPALGKIAKYAAYPAGIGAGVGVGAYVAGRGVSTAISDTGTALKTGIAPRDPKEAARMFIGVIILAIMIGLGLYIIRAIRGG